MSLHDSSFAPSDDFLGRLATAPPRRLAAKGTADIGGRMRVASILREHGLAGTGSPVRIAGSTNEVWSAGPLVVRVSFERTSVRLRREAVLYTMLPGAILRPKVYAAGSTSFGEYIVVGRVAGNTLSELWHELERKQRRNLVHELALQTQQLHNATLTAEQVSRLWGKKTSSELMRVSQLLEMTDALEQMPYVDAGLMNDAREQIKTLDGAFGEGERRSLVHGDLHFENILANSQAITALLDFEWAHLGFPEQDIDTIARYCIQPELHTFGSYRLERADFLDVLTWFREAYPAPFANPDFRKRLDLCAFSYELPAILKFPPNASRRELPTWHPINRLAELVNFGPAAVVLGW